MRKREIKTSDHPRTRPKSSQMTGKSRDLRRKTTTNSGRKTTTGVPIIKSWKVTPGQNATKNH